MISRACGNPEFSRHHTYFKKITHYLTNSLLHQGKINLTKTQKQNMLHPAIKYGVYFIKIKGQLCLLVLAIKPMLLVLFIIASCTSYSIEHQDHRFL